MPLASFTLLETLSQACLTRAWSTVSIPSFWVDCKAPSTSFLLISNWTRRLLNNWKEMKPVHNSQLSVPCENMSTIFKLQYRDIRTSVLLGVTPSSHSYLMRHLENPWLIVFECRRSFWLQIHRLIWIMCKKNGDIPHAAEYGMYPEAWWNKPDWLKIWLLQSDPHSVMPLIKLIIEASVPSMPSLNCTRAHIQTHTHEPGTVDRDCLQSPEPVLRLSPVGRATFWVPSGSFAALSGRSVSCGRRVNDGRRHGHGYWKVQRENENKYF